MEYEVENTIYTPEKFKYIEANDNLNDLKASDDIYQKNFMNGLKNARQILNSLQRSIQKSSKYEKQLIKCRCSHHHSRAGGWTSDFSEYKSNQLNKGQKLIKNNDTTDSVSSFDAYNLQFQYEDLYRRYQALQLAYDERCRAAAATDLQLATVQRSVTDAYEELARTHRTLISVGEKYLALKCRSQEQKQLYTEKLNQLRLTARMLVGEVQRARNEIDSQLGCSLLIERDAASALLLNEIRKCNLLYMDNVRLKELLAEIVTQDE